MPERLLHPGRPSAAQGSAPGDLEGIPEGFEALRVTGAAGVRTVILKSRLRDRLLEAGVRDPRNLGAGPLVAGWIEGGRTRHALLRCGDEAWVLKSYRRGGVLGRWNSSRYWGARRFLDELRVAAHAERAGIPTAEVLALVVERAGLGSVRAWLVTRYLAGVRPLPELFGDAREGPIFRAAGEAVGRMHEAGIDHPDLHIGNIMGSFDGDEPHVHIVDWDRARVRERSAWSPYANLVRLWRSVEKGRRSGGVRRLERPVREFIRGYFAGRPRALREARGYFRRRAFLLGVRLWLWRAWRWT
ncbi:MAG: hypothetical protein HY721_04975 [Planctomycetes bacterium]|nr:hypothetical protein [Planctomycetota bacterium]